MGCPEDINEIHLISVSFKTCVSLLIFCFDDLSIAVSGVLLLLLCYCQCLLFCLLVFLLCIEVLLCWMHRYLQLLCLPFGLIPDHYVVSFLISCNFFILRSIFPDMRIATPAFFFFIFAWNIFFHPVTFSLYVSWGLKWVSWTQHIYGSCFCIHSASLCLLVGAVNPFKVIIDIYVPIAIFLIVWGWFCRSFFFSCISWLYKSI